MLRIESALPSRGGSCPRRRGDRMRRGSLLAAAAGVAAFGLEASAQQPRRVGVLLQGGAHLAGVVGLQEALAAARLADVNLLVHEGKGDLGLIETAARELEAAGVEVIV